MRTRRQVISRNPGPFFASSDGVAAIDADPIARTRGAGPTRILRRRNAVSLYRTREDREYQPIRCSIVCQAAPPDFDFVLVTSERLRFEALAAVRNRFIGKDGRERLSLQLIDKDGRDFQSAALEPLLSPIIFLRFYDASRLPASPIWRFPPCKMRSISWARSSQAMAGECRAKFVSSSGMRYEPLAGTATRGKPTRAR